MEEEILKDAEEEQNAVTGEGLQGEDFSPQNAEEKEEITISPAQLDAICEKLGENWKKLAIKLGHNSRDIDFFERENISVVLQARNMLQVWFEDDPDASLENLCYILEGLGFNEVSDLIKNEYITSM